MISITFYYPGEVDKSGHAPKFVLKEVKADPHLEGVYIWQGKESHADFLAEWLESEGLPYDRKSCADGNLMFFRPGSSSELKPDDLCVMGFVAKIINQDAQAKCA